MIRRVGLFLSGMLLSCAALAINPYLYGNPLASGTVQSLATAVENKLEAHGFKVIGKYFPKHHPGYGVVVATDADMLREIGESGDQSIVGATIRIGVKSDGTVSYTNPDYWYRAFFRTRFTEVEKNVDAVQNRLTQALGAGNGFGGEESARSLSNYRYMVGMERLDSGKNKLNEGASFNEAVKIVRDNLAKKVGQTARVYEIILPGKQLAVFGVAFTDEQTGDANWLKAINMPEAVASLPYEIFIMGNEIHALHARYRLALSFPDTGMGTFMRISHIPNEVRETLSLVAGVKPEPDSTP